MSVWWLALIIASILSGVLAFIWVVVKLGEVVNNQNRLSQTKINDSLDKAAEKDVEHVFNNEFREELRNRGRLYFEKIIGDNAMFLQQDLRLTTSQLNDFLKDQMAKTLQDEFSKYEQSISDAKQMAVESIKKTLVSLEDERVKLVDQIQEEVTKDKDKLISRFENHMVTIINHYVLEAIGDQVDLSDQLEYIFADLEANKEAILEDLRNGL